MLSLVRDGVPNSLRGRIWMMYSGGYAYMLTKSPGYYQSLLTENANKTSEATADIEKVQSLFLFAKRIDLFKTNNLRIYGGVFLNIDTSKKKQGLQPYVEY